MNKKKEEVICGSAKVGSRGQLVIPLELRKKFEIEEGEILFVVEDGNHIKVMKNNIIRKMLDGEK
ncbi:MAG: AbrB/MazE/SpoVT family DNA-binding domain-containing protein [Nanoarchaeota archaeon]|nr:AbrB/MazE/SpoVT family DNA-binding domain-containing protein [Nanoarchaeota archaeon]